MDNHIDYLDLLCENHLHDSTWDFLFVSKFYRCDSPDNYVRIASINNTFGMAQSLGANMLWQGNLPRIKPTSSKRIPSQLKQLHRIFSSRTSASVFSRTPLSIDTLSVLLCNSYFSINNSESIIRRNIPSAGGTYPVEIYYLSINTTGLDSGIYHYCASSQHLTQIKTLTEDGLKDVLTDGFYSASRSDINFSESSGIILITAVLNRVTFKYKDRGVKFLMYDVGAINLCLYLVATTLGVSLRSNAGYIDDYVDHYLGFNTNERSTFLTCVIG